MIGWIRLNNTTSVFSGKLILWNPKSTSRLPKLKYFTNFTKKRVLRNIFEHFLTLVKKVKLCWHLVKSSECTGCHRRNNISTNFHTIPLLHQFISTDFHNPTSPPNPLSNTSPCYVTSSTQISIMCRSDHFILRKSLESDHKKNEKNHILLLQFPWLARLAKRTVRLWSNVGEAGHLVHLGPSAQVVSLT